MRTTAEPRLEPDVETDPPPEVKVEVEVRWSGDGVDDGTDPPQTWWRRHPRLVALVAAAIILLALVATAVSPLLDVDVVEVRGQVQTPPAQVLASAGIEQGQAMVGLDDDGAAGRIEALPWVRTASVEREWPGRVVVAIEERTAMAALAVSRRRWVVVDADGRRLEDVRSGQPPNVPVRGLPSPQGRLGSPVGAFAEGAVALTGLLPGNLRMRAPAVQVGPDGRLSVELIVGERRVQAVFGRPEQLRSKVISLATVIDTVDPERLVRIDLRRPSEPVLTRA